MENLAFGKKTLALLILIALAAGGWYYFEIFKNAVPVVEYSVTSSGTSDGVGSAAQTGTVAAIEPDSALAFVSKAEGKVDRKTASGSSAMASGDGIGLGDSIITGSDSRAEIVFADSSIVRLAANSVLVLKVATGTNTELELSSGEIWARILKPLTDDSFFAVNTSDLSAGVRGTSIRVRKIGKKSEIQVVDSVAKSAETPGVDIAYRDDQGVETRERLLPEEGFSIDVSVGKKEKKKIPMAEIMKDEFVRTNTVEDLVYMNNVRKAVEAGKNPVEAVLPVANEKFLAKFQAGSVKSYEERVNKELAATAPKKEEIPLFFTEPTVRERALAIAASVPSVGGAPAVIPLGGLLREAGHELSVIDTNRKVDRVRRELEGQAPDPEKQKEVKKHVEELQKDLRDRVDGWKKEPLNPVDGSGSVEASSGTIQELKPEAKTPETPKPVVKPVVKPKVPVVEKPTVPLPKPPKPVVKPSVSGEPVER